MHYDRRARTTESFTHDKDLIDIYRSLCANIRETLRISPRLHQIDATHLDVDVLAIRANEFELQTPRNLSIMNPSNDSTEHRPPENLPFRFASVCIGVIAEVTLGAVLGYWLDQQFGTVFFMLVGLSLGMILGTWNLIQFARRWTPTAKRSRHEIRDDDADDELRQET